MTIYRWGASIRAKGIILLISLAFAGLLGQVGCTRDDVAAAVSTVAVQLEATLIPWGSTTIANAQDLGTRIPEAFATAKAPVQTIAATDTITLPAATNTQEPTVAPSPTPLPSATPTDTTTPSPAPTSTETPIPTDTATPTATLAPTPYPDIVVVPGGWMTLISGGSFDMGAPADKLASDCVLFRDGCQKEWFIASEPVHAVWLDSFYIDTHEVTNEAFISFLNEGGEETRCLDQPCIDTEESRITEQAGSFAIAEEYANHPITGVTWYGATAYCAWRGGRLPTEAEWERVAAWDDEAGKSLRYPWGDSFVGDNVNFCDASCKAPQRNARYNDGFAETAPVTSFGNGLSPSGIYDMAGNVWEWVSDWYDPGYYAQPEKSNPAGPESGEEKVVRGGSWYDTGNFTASAIRFPSAPDNADKTIGFRCAVAIP